MTPTRTQALLAMLLGGLAVVAAPGTSLATHEVIRAREVRPNVYRWRDNSGNNVTHIGVAPHRAKWRNPSSGAAHNVRFYRTPSGTNVRRFTLAPGDTKTRRIPEGGTYKYYCTFHGDVQGGDCSGMCGRIVAH
jgi:plastocyanin